MKLGFTQKLSSVILSIGLGLLAINGYAIGTWNVVNPNPDYNQVYSSGVNCCYDSNNTFIYATWGFSLNQNIFKAAYYDGTTWNDISPGFGQSYNNICCCFDSSNNFVHATWANHASPHYVKAAYYSGSSWIDISPPLTNSWEVSNDVNCCYGNNSIFATWASPTNNFQAAMYDGTNWINITSNLGSEVIFNNIHCCYDNNNHILYATWADNFATFRAAYYNGSVWTDISPGDLGTVRNDVCCSFDSNNSSLYTTWGEHTSPFSFQAASYNYSAHSWTDITPVTPNLGGVLFDVHCCYNGDDQAIYATWSDTSNNFKAAFYDGIGWFDMTIPSPGLAQVLNTVNCCYNNHSSRLYATWSDVSNNFEAAYYGFFLSGTQKLNNFAVVSEWFNIISWQSPPAGVASYILQRNGAVIARLGGSVLSYEDHNRIPSVADFYLLSALDALGNTLATAIITIGG